MFFRSRITDALFTRKKMSTQVEKFYELGMNFDTFLGVSDLLCLSSSSALHYFRLVFSCKPPCLRDDRHLLVHAMASELWLVVRVKPTLGLFRPHPLCVVLDPLLQVCHQQPSLVQAKLPDPPDTVVVVVKFTFNRMTFLKSYDKKHMGKPNGDFCRKKWSKYIHTCKNWLLIPDG
jgi:hypothetical protein